MNNNITPAQFVEQWVPGTLQDWENVYRREIAGLGYSQEEKVFEKHRYVFAKFPEALAAFEAHIRKETWREACEEMRDDCSISVQDSLCDNCHYRAIDAIENTPIPEIPKNEKK